AARPPHRRGGTLGGQRTQHSTAASPRPCCTKGETAMVNQKQYLKECSYCRLNFTVDDRYRRLSPHVDPVLRNPCPGSGQVGKVVAIRGPGETRPGDLRK